MCLLCLTFKIANTVCFSIKKAEQARKENEEPAHDEPTDDELVADASPAKDEEADKDNTESKLLRCASFVRAFICCRWQLEAAW